MPKKKIALTNPHLAQLLKLMAENPHLPVVPMVNEEVVGDDSWANWMGSWGHSELDQYMVHNGRIYFKDDDDPFDVLERIGYHRRVDDMTDEEIDAAYEALPWKKAIIVYINTPED